ncbi:bifunctional [glutamate--ammonia ligase]-adenylyl-L-tyrosine phosphorylase/[glutamate--ammonia-ligase] adenylyltransferase [Thiohalobacter thiocyanaticus]|uniref:Bifunctional glutamine synthetase adenylyltransferase/adenylyl-removing enzyme n=1 Tax=Thiohalobacter thiocyanaticus TaxID=585455 RepID=A0A426QIN4_9GAMM|nr:bifunctional [glutamate--ammonia ligase]-adenylyl-L-tyrosine phosphorylase/[glutamate--ammonia-ligase] adenylyltransferase [Thiohalobacter thiocyanaticus]RRQ21619.1 bifunctional [glutamate--ammonia ligase]-adenylyl-L-tyrosine phosphorylase/[glutamate--ammonia-ligase] adenylyltransferase [Thiohalobacter thiocyanaticus]
MNPVTFEDIAAGLPETLREDVQRAWERYREQAAEAGARIPGHPDFLRPLARVWAASEFVAQSCEREPELLAELLESGELLADTAHGELRARAGAAVAEVLNAFDLGEALRRFRRREMVRIAWRDLAGWAGLDEVLRELTELATACLQVALDRLHAWLCRELGTPKDSAGRPQSLVVLGMGKLGAGELNFSSDIDLIFAYPEPGRLGKRDGLSYEEFFTRLGQQLIEVLNRQTGEGFVYRVDMRLRPYGDSGPLVMDFDMLEEYYQSQGREWERYALIKAWPVAGDPAQCTELMELLRPFIYRRYLDYGAFEQLREMKTMIIRQVQRRGMEDNIKLGPGGIREVEFIGQAFQLIRGGQEPRLRLRQVQAVLGNLAYLDLLPRYAVERLIEAYRFLRRVENRVQAFADEQTHELPTDEAGRARLALAMGFPDWAALLKQLDRHRRFVEEQFQQVFGSPHTREEEGDRETEALGALWQGQLDDEAALALLDEIGFEQPDEAHRLLDQLHHSLESRAMGKRGRERLDRLMPLLLAAIGEARDPNETLARLVRLLETISGRSAYLALLVENPMALSQLVQLCDASPWIAAELTRHPILLDELLDPRTLYTPPSRKQLEAMLDRRFEDIAPDDLETQMDALRHFKQMAVLRVAAADVAGATPLMVVSDYLTAIAELVLQKVLTITWHHLVARHGVPRCGTGKARREAGFAIIGYGKLGGIELGYGSDLDLVFLNDGEGEEARTEGPKPLDNAVFFARLGQRIIHLLNTLTPAGVLYEVDMRLRPSGASGLLVTDMAAFAAYQHEEAWTWEHQALVRARGVAGDPDTLAAFEAVRREVLCRQRDPERLRREVRDMRSRMRTELARSESGRFDLKQGPGGIADIEFIVQYGVLRWAHEFPDLVRYSDNIRLLEGLAGAGLMPEDDVRVLGNAYRAYRKRVHNLTLQEVPALVYQGEFIQTRAAVLGIWKRIFEGGDS